ncbi:MAG TPA: LCP family protein, partial [Acidimicrobiales bacterium]|nr:LCP family protein [Acidimicrobiales bacterium]
MSEDQTGAGWSPGARGHIQSSAPMTRRQRHDAERARRSRRRRKRILISLISVVGFLLLVGLAGVGFLWYENNRIDRIRVEHLKAVPTSGVHKDMENILLIGSTTRCGLAQQNGAFGICSAQLSGINSDVVMILHLDPDHDRASLLSIPRDTFVPNARHDGVNKIDAALGDPSGVTNSTVGDPSQLVAAIEDDFGIPIQHFVELNFDSFQGVVDALGGIKMYFPMPVYDA